MQHNKVRFSKMKMAEGGPHHLSMVVLLWTSGSVELLLIFGMNENLKKQVRVNVNIYIH